LQLLEKKSYNTGRSKSRVVRSYTVEQGCPTGGSQAAVLAASGNILPFLKLPTLFSSVKWGEGAEKCQKQKRKSFSAE
jgi:hypothetical protein